MLIRGVQSNVDKDDSEAPVKLYGNGDSTIYMAMVREFEDTVEKVNTVGAVPSSIGK